MPDGAVAVLEGKASFHQLPIDLIKEAEFHGIGGIAPDSEVAPSLSQGGAKSPGIGRMHEASLPCGSAYSSVTSRS